MSLPPDLVHFCLVVKGFPPDVCPAEVARLVSGVTQIPVAAIAPWCPDSVERAGGSEWLIRLRSHDEQRLCLQRYRALLIPDGKQGWIKATLDFPELGPEGKPLNWISIMEGEERMDSVSTQEGERMDSVATEAMYGDGNITEVHKPWQAQQPLGPQLATVPSAGPQGHQWQQHRNPGSENYSKMHYPAGFPDYPFPEYQPGCMPSSSSQSDMRRSTPNLSALSVEPRSEINSGVSGRDSKRYSHYQLYDNFYNPVSQGMFSPGMQPERQNAVPRYESNPIYPIRPMPAQGGPGPVPQSTGSRGMVSTGTHPQYWQYNQQPTEFPDAFMEQPDMQYQQAGDSTQPNQQPSYLKVTELPESITEEELRRFFQSRSESGGGTITNIRFNPATKSATIAFEHADDVERVLQRAPLLLKNKKICMEATLQEEQEVEKKTVEVRGLEAEVDAETCIYYFENPNKGGGDIDSYEWNEAEKTLFITFADAAVAQAVASKGHTVGTKVLEVALYMSPTEVMQCTVMVRGFNPTKQDLYEMYFSSPRSGGDKIVELCISEDETTMYITFETPEVAKQIVSRTHTVGGSDLEVVLASIEPPIPPSTIIVTDCDLNNEDIYRYYFENPRKGGGEISDLKVDDKLQAILITFTDPEVVQGLVDKVHKVGNKTVKVAIYTPQKSSPQLQTSQSHTLQDSKEEQKEEEQAPRIVVVDVSPHELEKKETYELYFESSRSGGSELEDVDVDMGKKLVYITFKDPAVAAKVAGRQHKLNGRILHVALYIPPKPKPTYPNKLLFKNVADSTTRDCLGMFLEKVTGLEVEEVLYGDEVGTVLVTFNTEPDLTKALQMCQKNRLEGRQLTVSKVPITNCLLVENINPATTKDTIEYYFENRRNNGGTVESVEFVPGEKKCLVYFEDHTVLDGVLKKSHTLDGNQLVVKRYLECMGQSGGSSDPTAFSIPKPITLDTLDKYKVAFLRQSQKVRAAFQQQLTQIHAEGKFMGDSLVLECTLTTTVPKARILARTWSVDARQAVENFFRMLEVHRKEVMQQLWVDVEKAVSSAGISSPEGAALFVLANETTFVVVGMQSMAQELFMTLSNKVRAVEDDIERRKQEVKETNNRLKPHQLRLLLAIGFHVEAEKRHEGLKVEINVKKRTIDFLGMMKDVKEAQVEMYEIITPIQSHKLTKLSTMQIKLLMAKEVKPYIVQKFKKEGIVAVWEMDEQSQVTVFALNDTSLVEAVHIINKSVPEHVCEMSTESLGLTHESAWNALVQRLMKASPGLLTITPDHNNSKVYITSTDNVMHGAVEEIEVFLQENSIYTQVVRFSPSRQLFVQQECSQRLINLQNKLQAYRVQILMKEAGTEFTIKGTNQGLAELHKELEKLNSEIVCHEEKLTDPGKVRCLNSQHTERDLRNLSMANHCVITLHPESSQLQIEPVGSGGNTASVQQMSGSIQTTASVQLPNGVTIAAVLGDITQLPVDVIVNAANDRMDHIGGLARDIVDKGGQAIQEESYRALKARGGNPLKEGDVLVTGAGKLRCKAVVHAVGPVFRGGYSGEEDCLHDTVIKCMTIASDAGHTSIAFPAISTGIFRFPPKEATRIITEAVNNFLNSHKKTGIRSVYLCHLTDNVARMFVDAIKRVFPSARSVSSRPTTVPKPLPRAGLSAKGAGSWGSGSTGQKVIGVAIVEGEIAKQRADVIINSTSNGLDLRNGAISSSILKKAGQGLQDECRNAYPTGITTGELAVTGGHGLACKKVYHLALCNWNNPNAQQVLGSCMMKCLTEASKQHFTSMAFPVLGTGNLGYPPEQVAETMLGAINQFQQETPSTSLRNVSIVIYHTDKTILQIFRDLHKKMGGGISGPQPQASPTPVGSRQGRRFSAPVDSPQKPAAQSSGTAGTSAIFEIGHLKLIIKQGDITEEKVDAIVNSSNSKLDLSRGGVASVLKTKCGEELTKECARKVSDIEKRGVTHTKAYKLESRVILHINSEKFSKNWSEAISLCLREAEDLRISTLAMPALGTGAYGNTPSQSASVLFDTLVKSISDLKSLKELRVVLFDLKMVPPFVSAVEELGNKQQQKSGGVFSWFKSVMTGGISPAVKQTYISAELKEASLYIYAASQRDIPGILRAFDDLVKDRFTEKEVNDDVLLTLGDAEVEQIYMLQNDHKVTVDVQKIRGRVVVKGLQTDVFEAMQKISTILRQVERSRQEQHAASMLANMVQWSFLEVTTTGTKAMEYDKKENQIIELAYQNKKKNAEFTDAQGTVYVIDFNSMMEYPKDDPSNTVSVLRQDKIKEMASGSVPGNWEPHKDDEHVKVVRLNPTDKEYKDVETNLRATLGSDRNITVTAIDRVQNRTLYQQYVSKRSHLQKQNVGIQNEKILWHGTGSEAIDNINNYGFNRSYCGKNATVYGQGVYFAVNSNYSTHSTYSPPDAGGLRHIYQCMVLVGHATQGDRSLRVLPQRQNAILFDSATDNLNNPGMYVIFNDTQAYPEYLITFK